MDLTDSYLRFVRSSILSRYQLFETRNAAALLGVTNPEHFLDVLDVLDEFVLYTRDLITAGGSESDLASRLNSAFRTRGWRESRVDTKITLRLQKFPFHEQGEVSGQVSETEVVNEGYKVDNFIGRVALDVEWNAKDGNLDRDLSAYRFLYDSGLIDAAVIITRTSQDLRDLAYRLGIEAGMPDDKAKRILGTTTTTNTMKLLPRIKRGDGGGCPLLVVAITSATWEGVTNKPCFD